MTPRYEVAVNGLSIRCLTCGHRSWNPNDVANRYCGFCHVFHEDEALREELEQAAPRDLQGLPMD